MPITGYIEYRRREYCKDIGCPVQLQLEKQQPDSSAYETTRNTCKTGCIHTTYEFHHWLIAKGYLLVRPQPADSK